jgi:glucose/arabinose dehydrogenase
MSRRILQAAVVAKILMGCQSQGSTQDETASKSRPFTVHEVGKFSTPWAMAFLPGSGVPLTNMALLTEKDGRLWLVDVTNGRRAAVSGVPGVKVAGQGGLGDVMPHPDFAGNHRVYLSYAESGANGTSGAVLGYGTLDLANPAAPALRNFKVIWRQQPKVSGGNHYSHRIAFAPDGSLFISSGERFQFDPAQDPNSDLGKIIHLTAEGQPIGGRFYTLGHRNVLGLAFAPDGRLWAAEMGPKGGDEINLILPGRNYGWPRVSNGRH